VIDKLASTLGRNDDLPNKALAREIATSDDINSVGELVDLLKTSRDKKIQSDCIKTLYEIGYLNPQLIAGEYKFFLELLRSKNNRLVWGAMIALNVISKVRAEDIYENLADILKATREGSVITKDNGIGVLINLYTHEGYRDKIFPLLMEQLRNCQSKQLPLYAERFLPVVKGRDRDEFVKLLTARREELGRESQRRRIDRVLKKLKEITKN